MNRKEIVNIIETEKLVLVTRLKVSKQVSKVLKSLINAGVKVMEITSNTPNFEQEITKARKLFPNVIIGVGTVINE